MSIQLIADSGSTKTEWCLLDGNKKIRIITQGISPYFLKTLEIEAILKQELLPKLKNKIPEEIFYYGTGCSSPSNIKMVKQAFISVFPFARVEIDHDLMGAAKAVCGDEKGIACILGTGSNSCYFNGKKIIKNSPGLGYVLGDEGSGAYLGKKVIQYYLYSTFEPELLERFEQKYKINGSQILDAVYRQPFPNRYLAGFTTFLIENRGHYMIENIIEDGINDFFFQHICKYRESWKLPIHFIGSVAFGFKDVLEDLCDSYELQLGRVMKDPMKGLIEFHQVGVK